ncbi:MAG TPA: uracil-DNA glycosylase [Thermoplasmata archaeon]|nr:uracil-DNA glycosylase [Thermoplasmata archaeon]
MTVDRGRATRRPYLRSLPTRTADRAGPAESELSRRPERVQRGVGPVPRAGAPRSAAGRSAAFAELGEEIRACRRCPLGSSRTRAVVYRGGAAPRVVFVGEAPGAAEDATGIPFVGRSGRLLDAAIGSLDLAPDAIGIVNVLKCRPPANRFDRAAAATCRPFLDRQLDLLRPAAIVSLGAWALRSLDPQAPPVLRAAGAPRPGHTPPLFPMIHPAASFRSRRLRDRWANDVGALGRWLRSTAV